MEVPIEDVPDLTDPDLDGVDWFTILAGCLSMAGWYTEAIPPNEAPEGYAIAVGAVSRTDMWKHAVVVKDGALAFDPCPGGDGLKAVEFYIVVESLTEGRIAA